MAGREAPGNAGRFLNDRGEAEKSPPEAGKGFLAELYAFGKEQRVVWEAYLTAGWEIGAEIK